MIKLYYSWRKLEDKILRVPVSDSPDSIIAHSREILNGKPTIGIPKSFVSPRIKQYQYLIKNRKNKTVRVYIFSRNFKDLTEEVDYSLVNLNPRYGPQYQIDIRLWVSYPFDEIMFPELTIFWREQSLESYKFFRT